MIRNLAIFAVVTLGIQLSQQIAGYVVGVRPDSVGHAIGFIAGVIAGAIIYGLMARK